MFVSGWGEWEKFDVIFAFATIDREFEVQSAGQARATGHGRAEEGGPAMKGLWKIRVVIDEKENMREFLDVYLG